MEQQIEPEHQITRSVWMYLVLAYGFAWTAWIVSIKLHASEEFLNIGTAGPALAAMVLSYRRHSDHSYRLLPRSLTFLALLASCWIVLSLYYAWRVSSHLSFRLDPWLIIPSILPAWIISGVFSGDSGVRSLLRRLVHRPDRWSLIGFLLFPAILLLGTLVAKLLHQPLVKPIGHGSITSAIAFGVIFFLYNLLFVAALEEPGWRGLLLDRLQKKRSPLVASVLVWLPWALWHAPLDYYRPARFSLATYLEIRVIFLIPLVIILTWLYNRSARSIQASAMFHASMNTFPFVLPYFMAGFVLLFVVAGYVIVADRMWRVGLSPIGQNRGDITTIRG
ncbi:MAG: CPBP family intramembrane metalloprotease [Acidobacteriales bacterium]|nr:CPBP family intramembrane metalloprotease [Terriglobales bacterium]